MNMCPSLQVAAAVAALLLARFSTAHACVTAVLQPHSVNPALAAGDTVAPTLTEQTKVDLYINQTEGAGCGVGDSCEGLALLNLKVAVMDNQSTPDRIGYRLNVVGGTVPPGVALPRFDTLAFGNVISIPWSPSESGDSFRFELSVAPIDEAGNVGEAQRVVVQRSDGGACTVNPGAGIGDSMPGIAVLAMFAWMMVSGRRPDVPLPMLGPLNVRRDQGPMSVMKLTALVAAIAMSTVGCASTYRSQEPGRISFVLDGPGFSLYKDGTTYGASGLSSGPVRAVAGNPAAEEHARTFVSRSRLFWSIYAVAVGCLVTSVLVRPNDPGQEDHRNIATGFAVAGFTGLATSLVAAFTAPGHLYDAVNIYNDGVAKQSKP